MTKNIDKQFDKLIESIVSFSPVTNDGQGGFDMGSAERCLKCGTLIQYVINFKKLPIEFEIVTPCKCGMNSGFREKRERLIKAWDQQSKENKKC